MASELMYEYQPITEADGIRLIELQPSEEASAPLKCDLIHTRLSLCDNRDIFGHYTALSYVWGNPEKSKTVLIDGKRLDITNNLNSALLDLRDEQSTLLLWADGMCINQADNEEKARQIGLMGRIYAGAQHAVIYLGPAESTNPERVCLATIRDGSYDRGGSKIRSVLNKEWFSRVWMFQELVFSTCPWLQCGRTRIKWDFLFKTLELVMSGDQEIPYSGSEEPDKTFDVIKDMQRSRTQHNMAGKEDGDRISWMSLQTLLPNSMTELLLARGFGVTDPRDYVFAPVGFASDGQREDLTVDYSKTVSQVYEGSARYITSLYGLSTLFECVGVGSSQKRLRNLPSWVPDWTSKIPANI